MKNYTRSKKKKKEITHFKKRNLNNFVKRFFFYKLMDEVQHKSLGKIKHNEVKYLCVYNLRQYLFLNPLD